MNLILPEWCLELATKNKRNKAFINGYVMRLPNARIEVVFENDTVYATFIKCHPKGTKIDPTYFEVIHRERITVKYLVLSKEAFFLLSMGGIEYLSKSN